LRPVVIPPFLKGVRGILLAIPGVSADLNEVSYNNSSPPKKDIDPKRTSRRASAPRSWLSSFSAFMLRLIRAAGATHNVNKKSDGS